MVRGAAWLPAVVVVAGCSAGAFGSPPSYEPVGWAVLVSADGRVITATGPVACGHAPRLVARSYPGKVSLILENPDINCNAEVIGAVPARARLPAPLGNRALVRAGSTRGTIAYFSERNLARVGRLPFGLRLAVDEPAAGAGSNGRPEIGDTRIYMSPTALMEVTQIAPSPPPSARPARFGPGCPYLAGWHPRRGYGPCRTVTWTARGYYFVTSIEVERGMTLSLHELRATAEGVRLSPAQYR
jgi:hypothetical protein